jgi:hypothetical protein
VHRIEEGREVARPALLALLALLLAALPASAAAAPKRGQDIRKVEAITTSAGALVRVTLRAPLDGPLRLRRPLHRQAGERALTGTTLVDDRPLKRSVPYLTSFGRDARGRVDAVSFSGRVVRLSPRARAR